jgi:RsiW-degrading membrane proteinase PrsW (M82 family)
MTSQPYLPAGPVGAVPPALLRRRTSALTWVTMIVLGVGALVIALLLLLTGGPVAAVVTTLLAAVSFPLLIAVCFWLDRYEPEPGRYRLAALGWGAVVAVLLSFIAEQLLFSLPGTSAFVDTAVLAPLVEEFGKGLFLVAVVLFRRSQIHGLLDGIVYAALVGIGFAFVEDILYYLSSLSQGGGAALTFTFILRGVMGPFAHPLFTSVFGVGVGIGVSTRSSTWRWLAPVLGYLGAVLLHGTWNGSTFWGSQGFLVAYAAVMLPLLLVLLALAIWARVREGRMLSAALQQTTALGWTRPEEIRWVARLQDRMSSRGYARRVGGLGAKRALRAFQQTLTEIAFLHMRALQGTAPRDLNQRMLVLLQHAADLRPYVVLPPPARPPAGLPRGGGSAGAGPVPGRYPAPPGLPAGVPRPAAPPSYGSPPPGGWPGAR